MRVNARMISKAAVRMEERALRASKEAKEAEDTARKADRMFDRAAQKAYKVAKAAKKQMLGASKPQEDDSESEEGWQDWDLADLPNEAEKKKARDIARKACTKAAQQGRKVRKAANKQMAGALQCLQSKPEDWEEYNLNEGFWWRDEVLGLRKKRRLSVQKK